MVDSIFSIIIAFIAVLLTLLKDFILPSIFKPRISLHGVDDGYCVEDASDGFGGKSRWIRLRIINKKGFLSRPAKNCYVKLLEIRNSEGERIKPFNPYPLMWVAYDTLSHDLAVGEHHYIDLVNEYPTERTLKFKIPISTELLRHAEEKLGPGEYDFYLGVYGDNFDPAFKKFRVKLTENYGEINFVR